MHRGEPFAKLFQIKLTTIGMKRHGHITELSPTHTRGQEMVPSMIESEEYGKLFGRDKNFETVKIDTQTGKFLGRVGTTF